MLYHPPFPVEPTEAAKEKASNGYLMSLIALMAGMPLPVINLLATGIFFMGNRRADYFTRWHCTQAMLSQITLFFVNAGAVGWTLYILVGPAHLSNYYIAYLITALLINFIEFVMTIYTAIVTRKGTHVEWWFWGALTHILCKYQPQENETDPWSI